MDYIDKIISKCIDLFRNFCSVLLGIMLIITSLHVFFRYVMNSPLIWSEETSLLLLIWFGFFSISNELYYENHIAIVMFYDKFPKKVKQILDIIRHLIITIYSVIMTKYLFVITMSIGKNKLPVSGIPKIFMYIPVILAAIMMCLYSIVLFINSIINIIRNNRREELWDQKL
ncbi:TRAP transporter small permease [Defluviitalea phaphyphila]|uniref:TRAP transporter small permease n=1 Tax=Defluviitalea phaphyphila TaxID=1473580 RepID=UPI00073104CA|nr:TRAP transporter small permease [Defluviitalea phaphyphila]